MFVLTDILNLINFYTHMKLPLCVGVVLLCMCCSCPHYMKLPLYAVVVVPFMCCSCPKIIKAENCAPKIIMTENCAHSYEHSSKMSTAQK